MEGAKTIEVSSRNRTVKVPSEQRNTAFLRHSFGQKNTKTPFAEVPFLREHIAHRFTERTMYELIEKGLFQDYYAYPTSYYPRQVSFDPLSRVAHPEDHIILSWRTPSGSGGHRRLSPCTHSGVGKGSCSIGDDDGSQTFPGIGEEPPLVVMAEALNVRFVSASAAPGVEEEKSGAPVDAPRAWGFRFTARGRKVTYGA